MQKIMFNDKYGLTGAVLEGRKTMTRRIIHDDVVKRYSDPWDLIGNCSRYHFDEVVAIAQAYKNIKEFNTEEYDDVMLDHGSICEAGHPYAHLRRSAGWGNKMFVKSYLMKYHIKITDIKVERLQACSDDDILKEGVQFCANCSRYTILDCDEKHCFETARKAFAALIDKVSGKGTWNSNPWCFCYEFKLID